MASQSPIYVGIYWAGQDFSLVALAKNELLAHETVPYSTPIDFGTGAGQDLPLPLRQAALLQKTLNENSVVPDKIALAIPPEELFFRVFTVPEADPSELSSLVEFESMKHIPLSIEEISYTYHTETIENEQGRRMRVYFCGIKKGRLKQYQDICEQSGFKPALIEPAGQGICRALIQKKLLPKTKITAVVIVNGHESFLCIVDHHRLIFLREFRGPAILDTSTLNLLVSELRTLLAFFRRQQPDKSIDHLVVIHSHTIPQPICASLQQAFEIPVETVTTQQIRPELSQIPECIAYSSVLGLHKDPLKGFNLITIDSAENMIQISNEFNVRLLAGCLTTAAVIVGAALFYANSLTAGRQKELETMRREQGKFASSTAQDIQNLTEQLNKRYDAYKNIRITSDTATLLKTIAKTLPEAAWLETVKIEYQDEKSVMMITSPGDLSPLRVTLFGGLFHPNPQEAFGEVNNLVENLRQSFQERFKNVVLVSINKKDVQGHPIAAFRIDLH